jgi:hypothetical protein
MKIKSRNLRPEIVASAPLNCRLGAPQPVASPSRLPVERRKFLSLPTRIGRRLGLPDIALQITAPSPTPNDWLVGLSATSGPTSRQPASLLGARICSRRMARPRPVVQRRVLAMAVRVSVAELPLVLQVRTPRNNQTDDSRVLRSALRCQAWRGVALTTPILRSEGDSVRRRIRRRFIKRRNGEYDQHSSRGGTETVQLLERRNDLCACRRIVQEENRMRGRSAATPALARWAGCTRGQNTCFSTRGPTDLEDRHCTTWRITSTTTVWPLDRGRLGLFTCGSGRETISTEGRWRSSCHV